MLKRNGFNVSGRWLLALSFSFFFSFSGSAQSQNLVANGDFESGLTGWTQWAAAPSSFWNGVWNHSNDCDIWVPTNGCPNEGAISHAQKKGSDAGSAHGGLYQTLSVTPGNTYRVDGFWSGGVTGSDNGSNGTWWEIVVYDGVVDDAIIDAGLRGPQDVLIDKDEANNLAFREVYQFQWTPFTGNFVAPSDTVTLVLKAGSFNTLEAAAYHDQISVTDITPPPAPVPVMSLGMLALLAGMLALVGLRFTRRAG